MQRAARQRTGQLAGAAAGSLLLIEVLRVWLPTVSFGLARMTPLRASGAALLGLVVLLAAPAAVGTGWLPLQRAWRLGAVLLVVGRLTLLLPLHLPLRLAATTVAVLGGSLVLTAIAAGGAGRAGRLGVLAGTVAAIWLHAGLGTLDLAWRSGPGATITTLVLVAVAAIALSAAPPATTATEDAAWPWLLTGPAVVLLVGVVGVPGRVASALGWSTPATVATTVLLAGAALLAALVAGARPPRAVPALGGLLVVTGTLGALPAAGRLAVLAQVGIAIGTGVVLGSAGGSATSTPRHRAMAAGTGWLLVVAAAAGALAGLELDVAPPPRVWVLASAALLAGGALVVARGATPVVVPGHRPWPAALAVAALCGIVATSAMLAAGPTSIDRPAPGTSGHPVRVAMLNVGFGLDPDGRFDPIATGRVLRELDADVIVLHDVDRGWLTTGGHDLVALLAAEVGMPATFAPAADEVTGSALLSRFPIVEWSNEPLPRGSDPWRRTQMVAVLEVAPEEQLGIVAARLSEVDLAGDTRLPQARAVAASVALLRQRDVPTVVLADLAAPPGSPEVGTFTTLVRGILPDGAATAPSTDPSWQPDHILLSPDLRPADLAIPFVQVADRLPVAVTVERVIRD